MIFRILDLILGPVFAVVVGEYLRRILVARRRRIRSEHAEHVRELLQENKEIDEDIEKMRQNERRWRNDH